MGNQEVRVLSFYNAVIAFCGSMHFYKRYLGSIPKTALLLRTFKSCIVQKKQLQIQSYKIY